MQIILYWSLSAVVTLFFGACAASSFDALEGLMDIEKSSFWDDLDTMSPTSNGTSDWTSPAHVDDDLNQTISGNQIPYPTSPPSSLPITNTSEITSSKSSKESTSLPTQSPSLAPSSVPTIQCRDDESYRSPINDLTCGDHRGTNCVHWRIFGLNTTELGHLIDGCPESCQVPCGGFVQFAVTLHFNIGAVPGLMDGKSKAALELVSRQHMIAYVRSKVTRPIVFDLDNVELLSQNLLGTGRGRHLRGKTIEEVATLEVRMAFEGFAIQLTSKDASHMILAGVDAESFAIALRGASSFFANAVLSPAAEHARPGSSNMHGESAGRDNPAKIVLSIIFAMLALTYGAWTWAYHRQSGKWFPRLWQADGQFDRDNLRRSPKNMSSQAHPSSLLSFDDSRASTHHAGNGAPMKRLLASLSLSRSRTFSDDRKYPRASDKSPSEGRQVICEHPLAKVIPAMLVIDNIDDDTDSDKDVHSLFEAQQVPGKMIRGSASLISALRTGRFDPSKETLCDQDFDSTFRNQMDGDRTISPHGLIMDSDSESDREDRPATGMVTGRGPIVTYLPRSRSDDELYEFSRRGYPARETSGLRSGSSPQREDTKPASSDPIKGKKSVESNMNGGKIRETHQSLVVPEAGSSSCDHESLSSKTTRCSNQSKGWTFSPLTKRELAITSKLSKISKMVDLGACKMRPQPRKPLCDHRSLGTDSSNGDVITTSSLTENTVETRDDVPTRYEFVAPRSSQLGLVLESDNLSGGPIVHTVKDYSPLLGLIQQGDKIVEVDGTNTSRYSLSGITRLLSSKSSILAASRSNLRIAILRKPVGSAGEQPAHPPLHNRGSSHGSSTITSHFGIGRASSFGSGPPSVRTNLEKKEQIPHHKHGASL